MVKRWRSTTRTSLSQLELSGEVPVRRCFCLLYTSDAADERSSVDLGGRRIIKKKKTIDVAVVTVVTQTDNAINNERELAS